MRLRERSNQVGRSGNALHAAIRGKKCFRFVPSYRPNRRQHFLKATSRTTRTEIIATEFLAKLLLSMNNAHPAFHLRFGREAFATLAGDFEV